MWLHSHACVCVWVWAYFKKETFFYLCNAHTITVAICLVVRFACADGKTSLCAFQKKNKTKHFQQCEDHRDRFGCFFRGFSTTQFQQYSDAYIMESLHWDQVVAQVRGPFLWSSCNNKCRIAYQTKFVNSYKRFIWNAGTICKKWCIIFAFFRSYWSSDAITIRANRYLIYNNAIQLHWVRQWVSLSNCFPSTETAINYAQCSGMHDKTSFTLNNRTGTCQTFRRSLCCLSLSKGDCCSTKLTCTLAYVWFFLSSLFTICSKPFGEACSLGCCSVLLFKCVRLESSCGRLHLWDG